MNLFDTLITLIFLLTVFVAAIAVTRHTRRTAVLTEQLFILALLESNKISHGDISDLVSSGVIDEDQGNYIINRLTPEI